MILSAVPGDNSSDFEDSTFLSLLVSINPFWVLIEKQINHFQEWPGIGFKNHEKLHLGGREGKDSGNE